MNWEAAVLRMREGHAVRRVSDFKNIVESPGRCSDLLSSEDCSLADLPVIDAGTEGCVLLHAWTVEEKPAMIFIGSTSRYPFVPSDEDRESTDWEIEL